MAQVTITINSREYAVVAEDGKEGNIIKLARMLDDKAQLITESAGRINENMLLAMVGLLIADELNELKNGNNNAAKSSNVSDEMVKIDKELSEKIIAINEQIKSVVNQL